MADPITPHEAIRQAITRHTQLQLQRPAEELRAELEQSEKEIRDGWLGISDFLDEQGHTMEETPPTQITAAAFRALLAKVNAPADFVEEELERWRARGLIMPDPEPEPAVEVALAAVLEKAVFQDERNRIPYSNGFREGFARGQFFVTSGLTRTMVRAAHEKAKRGMAPLQVSCSSDAFIARLTDALAAEQITNTEQSQLSLLEMERLIANTMNSGNDITPYEIAVAVRQRFTDFLEELSQ